MKLVGYAISIVCVLIGLARTHTETQPAYLMVDELAWNIARYDGKPVSVHGWVVAGSIHNWAPNHTTFLLQKSGARVGVDYAGVLPDTFKDQAELVARGTVVHDVVEATELVAKCGGKYEGVTDNRLRTKFE